MGWWTQKSAQMRLNKEETFTTDCCGVGQAIIIWWKLSNGLFSLSTFSWWELGDLPYTSSSLQKNLEVRKTRRSFPQTMRSVHMYVKLASSWNFLWSKLEWKVLWSLPPLLSLFQVFQFSTLPICIHHLFPLYCHTRVVSIWII